MEQDHRVPFDFGSDPEHVLVSTLLYEANQRMQEAWTHWVNNDVLAALHALESMTNRTYEARVRMKVKLRSKPNAG